MLRPLGFVLAALAIGTVLAIPAGASQLNYVALGDSSAAGPLIPNQIDATCLRSDHNWPHVLAGSLGATLTDVTCSGATTDDLTGSQFTGVAPQFDALSQDTDLVTLAIAANDIQLSQAFVQCAQTGPTPVGPTCQQRFTVGGADVFEQRIAQTAPKIAAALDEIHQLSPHADVLVVGYLTYWRPGGCYPADPFTPADADYIQHTFDKLMAMLAHESAQHAATYVDIRTPSAAHGLCEPEARRWLEGAQPASPAYPYHPNAVGMAHAAAIIRPFVPDSSHFRNTRKEPWSPGLR